jgi:hypothetical protein
VPSWNTRWGEGGYAKIQKESQWNKGLEEKQGGVPSGDEWKMGTLTLEMKSGGKA